MFGGLSGKVKGGLTRLQQSVVAGFYAIKGPPETDLYIGAGDALLQSGAATTTGRGLTIRAGNVQGIASTVTRADGGTLILEGGYAGSGGSGYGNNGGVTIRGGQGVQGGPGTVSADVLIQGGLGTSDTTGGGVSILGGTSGQVVGGSGNGGVVSITGGRSVYTNGTGGAVNILGGQPGSANNGGAVSITGGPGGIVSGNAGSVTIAGGTPAGGTGGTVTIRGSAGVGATKAGGNVLIQPGAATGAANPGNIQLDGGSGAALATTAIGGFVTIPTCAGVPTGVPVNVPTGSVPMVFDTTNSKFWIFTGGAWKGVVVT